jgi:hypothetical protein
MKRFSYSATMPYSLWASASAPNAWIHMHFVKGKPPEPQHATYPVAQAKRGEVALGRPGLKPGRAEARLAEFEVFPRRWRKFTIVTEAGSEKDPLLFKSLGLG